MAQKRPVGSVHLQENLEVLWSRCNFSVVYGWATALVARFRQLRLDFRTEITAILTCKYVLSFAEDGFQLVSQLYSRGSCHKKWTGLVVLAASCQILHCL